MMASFSLHPTSSGIGLARNRRRLDNSGQRKRQRSDETESYLSFAFDTSTYVITFPLTPGLEVHAIESPDILITIPVQLFTVSIAYLHLP